MNHPGEIAHLTDMVEPDVAIITTIAAARMAAFNSLDDIADAKAEIFQSMGKDGTAIIPADLPQTKRLAASARNAGVGKLVTFGADDLATARLICARVKPDRSCVRAMIGETEAAYCRRSGRRALGIELSRCSGSHSGRRRRPWTGRTGAGPTATDGRAWRTHRRGNTQRSFHAD